MYQIKHFYASVIIDKQSRLFYNLVVYLVVLMKKIINFRPIMFFALCLCLSLLTAYAFYMRKIIYGIMTLLFLSSAIACLWIFYRGESVDAKTLLKQKSIFSAVAVILSIIGALSFLFTVSNYDKSDLGDKFYTVTGKVTEVTPSENGCSLILSKVKADGSIKTKSRYKIIVYVYGACDIDVGDNLRFKAKLSDRETTYDGKFSAHYVANAIKYTASVPVSDITVLSRNRTAFESINIFIRDTLKVGLDLDEFTVAYALLCGNSDYMETEIIENFRASGVAHIFAVSGLHIGFFAVILNFITDKLRFNKYVKFFFVVSVLLFYSGVCGFTASSIRATIMTAVMLLAGLIGKKYDGLSSVALAGIIVLLYAPIQLFCVGFQLSFGVVLGINILSRPISKLLGFLPQKISSALGVVLSAQIFGIPISLATFGEFSLIAIIANFIFIPFVGVLYIALLVLTVIGGIFSISAITLFPINYVLKLTIILITAFDYRIFMIGGISFGIFAILYYLAFISWSDRLNLTKIARTIVCSISVVVFALGVTISNLSDNRSCKFTVIGTENVCATLITEKGQSALVINSVNSYFSTGRISRALTTNGVKEIDALILANSSKGVDVQLILTRLYKLVQINAVYSYGTVDEITLLALEKIFKKTDFYFCLDGAPFYHGEFSIGFALDGYCAVVESDRGKAYLFSEFGYSYAGYSGLTANADLVVATDYLESIYSIYRPRSFVSYRASGNYLDAERKGNCVVKF